MSNDAFNPARIRDSFLPFARPDYIEGLVIGDDLDSLLSASYIHKTFGWPVVGVYSQYQKLFFGMPENEFRERLFSGKFFALDLDIYHPCIPSLGHHILKFSGEDKLPGLTLSLNPNSLRKLDVGKGFSKKYPLATIHFLLWVFEEKTLPSETLLLTWLADSSFINAQQYRRNVEEWVRRKMPHPAFVRWLDFLQTPDFEDILQKEVLQPMSENPLAKPSFRSSYFSQHLKLNGFQCQFNPENDMGEVERLMKILEKLSGWPSPIFPSSFPGKWVLKRHEIGTDEIEKSGSSFDDWLDGQGVFSYAFTYRDRLNFTSF